MCLDSQLERHQLFSTLSLPYVCLILLSSTGAAYVADAYAKSLTAVPLPSKVVDVTLVPVANGIGVSHASNIGKLYLTHVLFDLIFI